MGQSRYLASLDEAKRTQLEQRLYDLQSGRCFICDDQIDLHLHKGQLDVDHIDPLLEDGLDAENNFALTHSSCNRTKSASNLEVARRLAEFERVQSEARSAGHRGANLGDVLSRHAGAKYRFRPRIKDAKIEYSFPEADDNTIRNAAVYQDKLSGLTYFFAVLPIEYIHHDDRINPRSIGANIRGLIEEFMKKRPQLQIGLAWWAPDPDGSGPVKMFDGQHKAAAQILLGVRELPVRVFLQPDLNLLLTANTNAAGPLRQVAFDTAVMRHLGSSLYLERVRQYQNIRGLSADEYSFTEEDLVKFFRGEHREMEKYIIDAQRDAIIHDKNNSVLEFVEWAGKTGDRPLAYSAIEKTFYREFLYKKALDLSVGQGYEEGTHPRYLERHQLVRLMSMFADTFFIGKWDPQIGGRQLEHRLQKGEKIPESHLKAWRVAREEILGNILRWERLVIEHFFAWTGQPVDADRLLQVPLPDELWKRIDNFLQNLAKLPCWIDKNLSITVFGGKQNYDFWKIVFKTGKAPNGVQVLAQPLDLNQMIQNAGGGSHK